MLLILLFLFFLIGIGIFDDSFFDDLNIQNFEPYFDAPTTLAKIFSLRGVPTSILIDKDGKEFARIMGSIDFNDQIFINWLKTYN